MLKSDGVYVFEFGDEVYYWMGAQVPFPKRRAAVKLIKRLWEEFERRNNGDDIFTLDFLFHFVRDLTQKLEV